MKFKTHFFGISLFFSILCFAPRAHAFLEFDPDKNWFFFLGSGLAIPSYDPLYSSDFAQQGQKGRDSHVAGMLDIPGIYFRLNSQTLLGIVTQTLLQQANTQWRNENGMAVQIFNLNLSALRFFSDRNGIFIRIDEGLSRFHQVWQSGDSETSQEELGSNSQLGLGYAFNQNGAVHILTSLFCFFDASPSHYVNGVGFNLGFLF